MIGIYDIRTLVRFNETVDKKLIVTIFFVIPNHSFINSHTVYHYHLEDEVFQTVVHRTM